METAVDSSAPTVPEPPVTASEVKIEMEDNVTFGASMDSEGMRVAFKGLSYSVRSRHNRRKQLQLLTNISGYFNSREMSALMGPSGSGKTTLLDVLAGRKTDGRVIGDITIAGTRPSIVFLRRYTGYVEQFATLIPTLTVHEMLMYTAELKRPREEPLSKKQDAVEEVIKQLALSGCRDVQAGDSLNRGISGGEFKRVNIGISLVSQPRVLFLDEPTSGLDSSTANEVMTYVQGLTSQGITVCSTIHSPTAHTFSLFDAVLLLLRGHCVYLGRCGSQALDYFRSNALPLLLSPPSADQQFSPAEWLVDVTSQADREGLAEKLGEIYMSSDVYKLEASTLETLFSETSLLPPDILKVLSVHQATVTPAFWALWVLIKYRTSYNLQDPHWMGPRAANKILMTFVMITLFWGFAKDYSSEYLIITTSMLFIWVVLPAFGAAAYLPFFVVERAVFVREINDGMYRVITYLVAKTIEELFVAGLLSAIMSLVAWWPLGLRGNWAVFFLAYYVTCGTGIAVAFLVAALSPNMDVANTAFSAYIITLLFFAGYLVRVQNIRGWWIWYSYIDFLHYGWGALMKNQFDGIDTPYLGEQTVLQYYGLEGINPWGWMGIESCFLVGFLFLAWAALTFVKHGKR